MIIIFTEREEKIKRPNPLKKYINNIAPSAIKGRNHGKGNGTFTRKIYVLLLVAHQERKLFSSGWCSHEMHVGTCLA